MYLWLFIAYFSLKFQGQKQNFEKVHKLPKLSTQTIKNFYFPLLITPTLQSFNIDFVGETRNKRRTKK